MAKRNISVGNFSSLADQVRQNLPNFLLGVTILVVFVLLSSLYLQRGAKKQDVQTKTPSLLELLLGKKQEQPKKEEPKKHTVKEGEHLWMISEKYYGSGYNAYDIARANNIENPDTVEVGVVLTIPEVQAKTPTKGDIGAVMTDKVTIPGSEYVVKEGDSLWSIAQGAYGDNYAWSRIATANKLENPDVIYAGQKLLLPR